MLTKQTVDVDLGGRPDEAKEECADVMWLKNEDILSGKAIPIAGLFCSLPECHALLWMQSTRFITSY